MYVALYMSAGGQNVFTEAQEMGGRRVLQMWGTVVSKVLLQRETCLTSLGGAYLGQW